MHSLMVTYIVVNQFTYLSTTYSSHFCEAYQPVIMV